MQVVIYGDGDGYMAQRLDGDVASEGDTAAEARTNVRGARQLCFADPYAGTVPAASVSYAHVDELILRSA